MVKDIFTKRTRAEIEETIEEGLKDPALCGRVSETPTRGQKIINLLKGGAPTGAHVRR